MKKIYCKKKNWEQNIKVGGDVSLLSYITGK